MSARPVFGAVFAAALACAPALAQQQSVRVRGTIEQVDGPVLTVKSRDGETLKLKMADDVKVVAMVKASLADIKPGSFVGSTAMPEGAAAGRRSRCIFFPRRCAASAKAIVRSITGRIAP